MDSIAAEVAESTPRAICVRWTFAGWRVMGYWHVAQHFCGHGHAATKRWVRFTLGLWSATVFLTYRTRDYGADEWKDMDYSVRVVWTDCALGGQRAWWQCPAVRCGRRVAVLYGGGIYACRHCHNLAYRTQREQAYDRASSRADRIRKLGWEPGILNGSKGMHWRTFERLHAAHEANVQQSLAGIAARFGLLGMNL